MEENVNNPMLDDNVLMGNKKNNYPQEFKDQIIGVYKSGVYASVAACAEAYNLCPGTLHGWLKKYNIKSSPSVISEQQAELSRLKKELARAKMENEILKKATIYFAKQAQ